MKPRTTKPATGLGSDKNILRLPARAGVSNERQLADLATDGIATNAMTAQLFLAHSQPDLSITEMVQSLKDHGQRVNGNDLAAAEQMLTAQAIALNAIFSEMARRAALNLGEHLDATDRYMRLALKAQGQCRATLETLAAVKNPPVVFARQANIAHGPQQVNNGAAPAQSQRGSAPSSAYAHEQSGNTANELLGAGNGERLDSGAQGTASRAHSKLATLGTLNRAKVGRRTRQGCAEQP